MLNKYPLWKNLLIIFLVIVGFVYALPNIYTPDPALQINGYSGKLDNPSVTAKRIEADLKTAKIGVKAVELTDRGVIVRLNDKQQQLRAKDVITSDLGSDYIVALNLAENTPQWLLDLGAEPMNLGLDLSGGVHFLLQVDTDKAISDSLKSRESEVRTKLREKRLRYKSISTKNTELDVVMRSADTVEEVAAMLRTSYPDLKILKSETNPLLVTVTFSDKKVREVEDYAVKQNLTSLRNRVNELGVSDPIVQRQGRSRIVVQLPGVQDTAQAKRIIGKTANLSFHLEANGKTAGYLKETLPMRANPNLNITFDRTPIVKGDQVTNAQPVFDHQSGMPQVAITLDGPGGVAMNRATRDNIGRRMAVEFLEYKTKVKTVIDKNGKSIEKPYQEVDRSVISAATIQSALGNRFVITGLSQTEARELSLLLRAGALAAPVYFVEERTVGPSMGAENIRLGIESIKVGLSLIIIFMLLYYRAFGFVADIALGMNLVMMVAAMSILGATLTMPGIAGMVLTVGMAVDSNVLIFARIRDELKQGRAPQQAVNAGFDRAFSTIFDAQITTFLVGVILYAVGTGPVKGFAVTLMVGIITSMFTTIMLTRGIVNVAIGGRNIKKLWI